MTKRKTIYDGCSRAVLIQLLQKKDNELAELRSRSLDDYVRELIQTAIQSRMP